MRTVVDPIRGSFAEIPRRWQVGLSVSLGAILGKAAFLAEEARLSVMRILAAKGVTRGPEYPEWATRQKALQVIESLTHAAPAQSPSAPVTLERAVP
jgi:hypothetical protein